jgi:hypothetical protein
MMVWKIWKCDRCGWEVTDGHIKHEYEEVNVTAIGLGCKGCGGWLVPYYHESQKHVGILSCEERVSLAMGVHPSQIKEAEKAFPGSRYRADGALLYMGRSGQKAAMKQRGYVNYN